MNSKFGHSHSDYLWSTTIIPLLMDETLLLAMQAVGDDENGVADEDVCTIVAAAATSVSGAEAPRLLRNENRKPPRNYLTQSDLPPNPHLTSIWESEWSVITTMGFDVATFKFIIDSGFRDRWLMMRADAGAGNPRPGGKSLDVYGALGLVLHYLNFLMRKTERAWRLFNEFEQGFGVGISQAHSICVLLHRRVAVSPLALYIVRSLRSSSESSYDVGDSLPPPSLSVPPIEIVQHHPPVPPFILCKGISIYDLRVGTKCRIDTLLPMI